MLSASKCILVIGGTSGIGEAFARHFHAQGKSVIVTGRRQERLRDLERDLPGVKSRLMDNADLEQMPSLVKDILTEFPDIDTVWINSGIQKAYDFADGGVANLSAIAEEVTVNVTAPLMLARLFLPHLLSTDRPTCIAFTSSALAFVPLGVYPVYCPTKAAIHAFAVGLRQQLQDTNVRVVEIAPPYVETELDADHRGVTNETPMLLRDYTAAVFQMLDQTDDNQIKEVAVGFAKEASEAWRHSIGAILAKIGVGG
ncbi:hypothetical protein H2200_009525 [Cladophialophora chaetospira]|uniref:Oxidoreductase DltE n=1 Tax=Cladophialophora chaetospira TaxID=386627 RepID=A0AA39CEV0_9EURO|nr:hypothetical protein H2200_009525 [Cladophialophora chaetospira]